jgi:putative membrane protein
MKWTGFGAIGCAVLLTIACSDDGRSESVIDGNDENQTAVRPAEPGDTVGTSGQADQAHGATADARHFAEQAAYAGNAEVKLGQLAAERAQSSQVKEFAQMMVRDHTKAGNELKQAVSRHDVSLPTGLDDEHQRLYDRLSRLRGAEFDREYMKAMVDGHMKVVSLLEGRADDHARADRPRGTTGTGSAADTQVDAAADQWATKSLPTVKQHLQKAEQIQGTMQK